MSIQNEGVERTVVLGADIPEGKAKELLSSQPDIQLGEGAIPNFTHANRRSFKVDYTILNGDLVLHFYLPKHATIDSPESRQAWMAYWLKDFPAKLDSIAQEYFEAGYPRLMAKYTEEVSSWWFKAQGFGVVLNVGEFVQKFLDKLDESLQVRS